MTQITPRAAIILAAGKSTRMKSKTSKVLHKVGGRAQLGWVDDLASQLGAQKKVCVVGDLNDDISDYARSKGLDLSVQNPQEGTAHAVLCAKDHIEGFEGNVAILYGDTPLITPATLEKVYGALEQGAGVAVLGFRAEDPAMYGRLITQDGELVRIVEAREATAEELAVDFCNSGVVAASAKNMLSAVERVKNDNAKGEYYLTDIVEILRGDGLKAVAVEAAEEEVLGVNHREDLAMAEQAFQQRMRKKMMLSGVTLRDPATTFFSYDTQIEPDADIGANVVFGPGVSIGANTVIHPFCHLEGAEIGQGAQIGPFARLRPGTKMDDGTKAGNFVETKKAHIGKGSKINHLSYIGDAEVGQGANIGAGTITCNYDGYDKHKTVIGNGAFVGTNSSLVAPVKIGDGAYLGSGGVITKDVPDDALAVARASQVNKEGWAKRYREAKAKRKKD